MKNLYLFPALYGAYTRQGKASFLGFISPAFLQNFRVQHHGIARPILEGDDAPIHADHIGGHAHAAVGVGGQGLQQVAGGYLVLFNPVILKKSGPYNTKEGCLSLEGVRPTKRWKSIKVQYETADGKPRIRTFTGWTAQIIQHEIDHCDGILI
jgi:peptide deformylase